MHVTVALTDPFQSEFSLNPVWKYHQVVETAASLSTKFMKVRISIYVPRKMDLKPRNIVKITRSLGPFQLKIYIKEIPRTKVSDDAKRIKTPSNVGLYDLRIY